MSLPTARLIANRARIRLLAIRPSSSPSSTPGNQNRPVYEPAKALARMGCCRHRPLAPAYQRKHGFDIRLRSFVRSEATLSQHKFGPGARGWLVYGYFSEYQIVTAFDSLWHRLHEDGRDPVFVSQEIEIRSACRLVVNRRCRSETGIRVSNPTVDFGLDLVQVMASIVVE